MVWYEEGIGKIRFVVNECFVFCDPINCVSIESRPLWYWCVNACRVVPDWVQFNKKLRGCIVLFLWLVMRYAHRIGWIDRTRSIFSSVFLYGDEYVTSRSKYVLVEVLYHFFDCWLCLARQFDLPLHFHFHRLFLLLRHWCHQQQIHKQSNLRNLLQYR